MVIASHFVIIATLFNNFLWHLVISATLCIITATLNNTDHNLQ